MNKSWIAVLAAGLVSLAAVAEQQSDIVLDNVWVRALPPTQTNTAAYLTISNRGEQAITVTGASTSLAGTVEIHTTREIDGYMRMEQLQDLSVPAGQSAQLAPGGTHLMLMELATMPAPGETVRLCLELATGDAICTEADVRKSAVGQQTHDHHKHHQK